MNIRDFAISLGKAETEEQVIDLLKKLGYWDDPTAWKDYGGNENNFSAVGNQQNLPEAALVEKLTNSVDAVLMGECMARGVSPDSEEAPSSMKEAVAEFFGVHDGELSNMDPRIRSTLAEKIKLIATGTRTKPNYIILDEGEGQSPNTIEETILSLGTNNKLRIPFVQGKFNMGGTGVFQFCGKHNLQLVITKRDPRIASNESGPSEESWAVSIVRRENPTGLMRSSKFTYLAPQGQILSFDGGPLPLAPSNYPNPYGGIVGHGTFIKLFEYQMSPGLRTNIVFDLYNRLSLMIPNVALPVRLYERRRGYAGHSLETNLFGLSVRLDEDRSENLESGFPTSSTFIIQGQPLTAAIYAFKKNQSAKYIKDEGVIFTINGQTHGSLPRTFYKRKRVKMDYLADSILVVIDASNIEGRAREDLFMNSRDRLRSGTLRNDIERRLEDEIRNHQGLKQLRAKRREEELERKIGDSKPLKEVLQEIIKKSPTLSALLSVGGVLKDPFNLNGSNQEAEYSGKRFPTFFKLHKEFDEDRPKAAEIGRRFRVKFKTDAENDYFDRATDSGTFSFMIDGSEHVDRDVSLWNGTANLSVSLPQGVKVGQKLHVICQVDDVSRAEPVENGFYVEVVQRTDSTGTGGKRRESSGEDSGEDSKKPSHLALPHVNKVYKEQWEDHGFNKGSSLHVIASGEEGYDFYINMDNIHLLTEIKGLQEIDTKLLQARYEYAMVLVGLAMIHGQTNQNGNQGVNSESENEEEVDISKLVFETTKSISPVILPMISALGSLTMDDISEDETEEEAA